MIAAWIALGALVLFLAAVLAAHSLPAALAALTAALVAGLWAYALWLARRANARRYHRHGRPGVHHHIRPTRRHRARLFFRRVRSVRIRLADTTTRTA